MAPHDVKTLLKRVMCATTNEVTPRDDDIGDAGHVDLTAILQVIEESLEAALARLSGV